MLRSFARHFNETVFRGPDTEGTGDDQGNDVLDTGGVGDVGGTGDGDAGESGDSTEGGEEKTLTVREQIKKSIAETSEPAAKPKKEKTTGRFGDRPAKGQEATPAEPKEPVAGAIAAPESLPKEAKAEWEKTPPAVQQAFIKREQDMAAGVEQLKQKYNLIDQAIASHTDALRQMNATPQEAVNRMFLWFKALAGRPADAFPALAQSMGIDWKSLTSPAPAASGTAAPVEQQQGGQPNGGAPEIPEPVRQYVGTLENQVKQLTQYVQQIGGRFGNVEQNLNSQNEARTRENLTFWSKDKPHFEDVRVDMAKMIESGIVPLLANGQVDLDTAYERAIYFNPEVRAKVLAEQQQANTQVQQDTAKAATTAQQSNVNRARKASVSLPASTTPGQTGGPATKRKPGEKLSVRDSLKAAVAELRDQ